MNSLILGVPEFDLIRGLLYNEKGNYKPGIRVDSMSDYPAYKIIFDSKADTLAITELINERNNEW